MHNYAKMGVNFLNSSKALGVLQTEGKETRGCEAVGQVGERSVTGECGEVGRGPTVGREARLAPA